MRVAIVLIPDRITQQICINLGMTTFRRTIWSEVRKSPIRKFSSSSLIASYAI